MRSAKKVQGMIFAHRPEGEFFTKEPQNSKSNPEGEVLESAQSFIVATRTRTEHYAKELTRNKKNG